MFHSFKSIFYCFILFSVFCYHSEAQFFKHAATYKDLKVAVTCITLSFDGTKLITGDSSGTIIFRDPSSGNILSEIHAFRSPVEQINFNSTGRLLIANTRNGEIKIYDFASEKVIHSLYSPEYADMRFALFSIADGFIYFNGQGRLYKTRSDLTQRVEKIYESDSVITCAVITDDRNCLIFGKGNSLQVLNTRNDHITQELVASLATIEQIALSPDHRLMSWSSDGTIFIRKYALNQLDQGLSGWFKAGTSSKMEFSHNGNLMVTGRVGTWARIWKPFEKSVVQELFGHHSEVTDFVFSTDDQTLFTSGRDKTIMVWKQKKEEQNDQSPNADTTLLTLTEDNTPLARSDSLIISPGSVSSMPPIEINNSNIPAHVGGRKVDRTTVVEVNSPTIDIYVFDNSTLDGDVISLTFKNQWILTHYEVTKKKKKITLNLSLDSNNYLVLFADNLGKTPPNTAAISFDLNGRNKIFRLESDLKSCSSINFIYKTR